jgi:alpha-tubulin suppressor-like RCC1 family protein
LNKIIAENKAFPVEPFAFLIGPKEILSVEGNIIFNTTYSWGYNVHGELGDGTTANKSNPVELKIFEGEQIEDLGAGFYHSAIVTKTGKLYTWGYNNYGQLGDGTTTQRTTPTLIYSFKEDKAKIVSLGEYHSAMITESGKLYTWGFNGNGRLGDGTTTNRTTPTLIDKFNGEKVISVSLGHYHSAAITESGKLYTWGLNDKGQLGDGTTVEKHVPILIDNFGGEKVIAVSLGGWHSSAITESGKLYTWGRNDYGGALGDGTTVNKSVPTLIDRFNGEKIKVVNLGFLHSSAITETGKLYTWGYNNAGQLGDGTIVNKSVPTLIDKFNGEKIITVNLGGGNVSPYNGHSSAITESGKLYMWGLNNYGQLGDGTTVNKTVPTLIDRFGYKKASQVCLGGFHTLVVTTVDPGIFEFRNLIGSDSMALMGAPDATMVSSDKRIDVEVMAKYTDITKDNDLYLIVEARNGQKILGIEEMLENKYYGHCEYNIYDDNTLLHYCAKGRPEFQTTNCNANCPFYKQHKILIQEQLEANGETPLLNIKNLSSQAVPTEDLSSLIIKGIII